MAKVLLLTTDSMLLTINSGYSSRVTLCVFANGLEEKKISGGFSKEGY